MKLKTINSIICRKFDQFVDSITDPEVKELVRKNTIITGGCITSMLLKEKVNDFDLYFRDAKTVFKVAKYFTKDRKDCHVIGGGFTSSATHVLRANIADKEEDESEEELELKHFGLKQMLDDPERIRIYIKSRGVSGELPESVLPEEQEALDDIFGEDEEDEKEATSFEPTYVSSNAITLTGKMQLIIRFYGNPDEIHGNYDFVHCMNYWDSSTRKVTTNKEALECILAKELRYVGSKYPLCSIFRTRKFIERGWRINAGQYLKMALQLNELDLLNYNVLEDQLVGVDAHFFLQILGNIVEDADKEMSLSEKLEIDQDYLMKLIDRIFN